MYIVLNLCMDNNVICARSYRAFNGQTSKYFDNRNSLVKFNRLLFNVANYQCRNQTWIAIPDEYIKSDIAKNVTIFFGDHSTTQAPNVSLDTDNDLGSGFKRPKNFIVKYENRKNGVKADSTELKVKYKSVNDEEAMTGQAGSTASLMEDPSVDIYADEEDYDPFMHRIVTNPTSDMDTFIHLLKGSLGSGILSMPLAMLNAGLVTGLLSTFIVGGICTYCVHILVKTSHELCRRRQTPSLGFAETAEAAFLSGPLHLQKYSRLAKALINTFLVIDLLGCCCIYNSFVAKNIKQVVDFYTQSDMDLRVYIGVLLPFLVVLNTIKSLKYLAPLSMIANILMATGMGVTIYYVVQDLPDPSTRPYFSAVNQLPLFFGTVIFALEGIGVVMPLENNMRTPQHFTGCPGVLNFGMFIVVTLYAIVGFLGYLKYGNETESSITLNLPKNEVLAQSVKLMIAVSIFFSFSLQFYVPMEIIWKNCKHYFGSKKNVIQYVIRNSLIVGTVVVAITIPNLGPFISLIGALCLSTLGLMFPAIIELITYWEDDGFGYRSWMLYKDFLLIAFGMLGFIIGTYVSIKEITSDII